MTSRITKKSDMNVKILALMLRTYLQPIKSLRVLYNVMSLHFRWQDRCLQIRLAAQELLVAELKNLGPKGRKHLVDVWGAYLPKFGDPPFQSPNNLNNGHEETVSLQGDDDLDELEDDDEEGNDDILQHRRNQTTAVILLG